MNCIEKLNRILFDSRYQILPPKIFFWLVQRQEQLRSSIFLHIFGFFKVINLFNEKIVLIDGEKLFFRRFCKTEHFFLSYFSSENRKKRIFWEIFQEDTEKFVI